MMAGVWFIKTLGLRMRLADRCVAVAPSFLDARLDALYQRDARGRLLFANQWDAGDAPRFHLLAGVNGCVRGYGAQVPDEIVAAIEQRFRVAELALGKPSKSAWLAREPTLARDCAALLDTQQRIASRWSGPVYRFPKEFSSPTPRPGLFPGHRHPRVAQLGVTDGRVVRDAMPDWVPDVAHRQPFFAMLEPGDRGARAVSVCASVRIHEAMHEAGIETLPSAQRRGYALATTAAWAAAVRDQGAEPIYSTSWHNAASLRVAARLGLEQFGVDYWVY